MQAPKEEKLRNDFFDFCARHSIEISPPTSVIISNYVVSLIEERERTLLKKIYDLPEKRPEMESDYYDQGLSDMKSDVLSLFPPHER